VLRRPLNKTGENCWNWSNKSTPCSKKKNSVSESAHPKPISPNPSTALLGHYPGFRKRDPEPHPQVNKGVGPLPRILLVEDEQILRDVLVPILFSAGYDCREAADGQAAIELLRSGIRINLVLSNMLLPKVDGWSLFLHVGLHYPRIPFAFVTAVQDASIKEVAIRKGVAGYLLKPFEPHEFLATVRDALAK
jgi:CheY-like chemotaxis protein